ncbi:MAG: transposase [Simkaniaceae bacterium]|nr:transposase [Simkaniaceae bacterium]
MKKTLLYIERNHEKRITYLQKLRSIVKESSFSNLVYVDESGFDPHTYRPCAWSPHGRKTLGNRWGRGGKRTNLIAAKRGKELLAPVLYEGSTSAVWFNQWFEKHLLKELNPDSTIIMDNAAFHKKEDIHALAEAAGHRVLFLPPYSPDFNPIEQDFAILKRIRQKMPLNTTIDQIVKNYGTFLN